MLDGSLPANAAGELTHIRMLLTGTDLKNAQWKFWHLVLFLLDLAVGSAPMPLNLISAGLKNFSLML